MTEKVAIPGLAPFEARCSSRPHVRLPFLLGLIFIIGVMIPRVPAIAGADTRTLSSGTCAGDLLDARTTAGCALTASPQATAASAAGLSAGFTDTIVWRGLTQPTVIRFSPDGRIFVAEKSGVILVYDGLNATAPTVFADLSNEVDDYSDRGLLGMALDPNFPVKPYIYVLYTYDAPIGGNAPTWNDTCPTPPGPTTDGCVVSGRLSRLTASGDTMTGTEDVLTNDWCQQFPSHSIGTLYFGADGALYAGGGDGASWTAADYGQFGGHYAGDSANPCGDPPGGIGGAEAPPTAEGGALRAQSLRRAANEPVVLDGSIIRIDPATGLALPDNPDAGSSDANAARIVAYGLRNPFRFTIRPGTNQLWIGNVGMNDWESIDRVDDPTASPVENFGWPCYEGPLPQPLYAAANLNLCTSLYQANTWTPPVYAYNHANHVVPGDGCSTGGSAISGLAFYEGGFYPSAYNGALFFADYIRDCIWVMFKGPNGDPDPTNIATFETGASHPADLETGPDGDLFYVGVADGTIHRIQYRYASGCSASLGMCSVGSSQDSGDANTMTGSRVIVGAEGETIRSISVYVGAVDSAPSNQYSVAIYSDNNGTPGTLVAHSSTGFLTASSWNTLPVSAALQANTAYWLVYNSDGSSATLNDLYYNDGTSDMGVYSAQPFGSWSNSFGNTTLGPWQFSIYATADTADCQLPVPDVTVTPANGSAPRTVAFDASESTDPNPGGALTYSWDLNGDGVYGDATGSQASFTYTQDGIYGARVRLTDSACGDVSTSPTITVRVGAPMVLGSAQMSLTAGWNFIDVPLFDPTLDSMAAVVQSMNDQVGRGSITVGAVYQNGRFLLYVPGYSQDIPLDRTSGIVIDSSKTGGWKTAGYSYNSGQSLPLQAGWNLIAAPYPYQGLTASAIANETASCGVQEIAFYTGGSYRTWAAGDSDFPIPNTSGMWILCQTSATWAPS